MMTKHSKFNRLPTGILSRICRSNSARINELVHGANFVLANGAACASCQRAKLCRTGFTIIEMLGTFALLGVLFTITVPTLVIIARERHAAEQRQFALQHLANLIETVRVQPWSALEPGPWSVPDADADLLHLLPGLERTVTIQPFQESPESRQVVASIRWRNRAGQLVAPIQISTWVFAEPEGKR